MLKSVSGYGTDRRTELGIPPAATGDILRNPVTSVYIAVASVYIKRLKYLSSY